MINEFYDGLVQNEEEIHQKENFSENCTRIGVGRAQELFDFLWMRIDVEPETFFNDASYKQISEEFNITCIPD